MQKDSQEPRRWLATCYDGNDQFVGVIDNVSAADLADHLVLTSDHTGIEFNSVVELPDGDISGMIVAFDGRLLTIEQVQAEQREF
jgi:hypothetical protein